MMHSKLLVILIPIFLIQNSMQTEKTEEDNLPISCSNKKIKFYLYNQNHSIKPYKILTNDLEKSIQDAPFEENKPFKFLIHGYIMYKNHPLMKNLREEYLLQNKWNVLVMDFHRYIKYNYIHLVMSVLKIGKCGALLIDAIIKNRENITTKQFHLIGFSTGAHIAANIANNLTSGHLKRITGLDPALPFFNAMITSPLKRLNKEHAEFVDVIITNAGVFGVLSSGAHIDVYVNGGTSQPGCLVPVICSHLRALEYFIESINSKVQFIAFKCPQNNGNVPACFSCGNHCSAENEKKTIIVGEHATPPKNLEDEGKYMLRTNSHKPFAHKYY